MNYSSYETAFNDTVKGETFVIPTCPHCGSRWKHYWKDNRVKYYDKYVHTLKIQSGCVTRCLNQHEIFNGVKYHINYD